MSDIAISVENLSKKYHIGRSQRRHDTLRDALVASLKAPLKRLRNGGRSSHDEEDTIWALKEVSFEVKRGEVVGVIGHNGAGKSTLLKILSQITEPTSGRALIHGRVGSLLEVGTGFHQELTGRENIYLSGAILGMRREEIDRKFDEIVNFSGVEKFIDTPIKRYSSGMKVRLGFAVAAHLDPEVLLVDEVLAVGDAEFQRKCLGKMSSVATEGRTIIFVSHNMGVLNSLCHRSLLFEKGQVRTYGATSDVIRQYLGKTGQLNAQWNSARQTAGPLEVRNILIQDQDNQIRSKFNNEETITVLIDVEIQEWIPYLKVGFELQENMGMEVFTTFHNDLGDLLDERTFRPGVYRFYAQIPPRLLNSGTYYVSPRIGIHRREWLFKEDRLVSFEVDFQVVNKNYLVAKRPGVISPLLTWQAHLQETVQ